MGDIIGTFYFKRTKSGNLIGKYTNCGIDAVDAEVANTRSFHAVQANVQF